MSDQNEKLHEPRINWINLRGLIFLHSISAVAIWYLATGRAHWATITLTIVWYWLTGLSITAGYHRAFSHRAYDIAAPLRWFFLLFGAGALQTSVLQWSVDHRNHHHFSDTKDDPYSVREGFWWAHVGWVLRNRHGYEEPSLNNVQDLVAMPGVRFQHKYYDALGVIFAFAIPTALATLWGDPWGGVLVAGGLRTLALLHATWCVNSVAHWFGERPYSKVLSARNSFITALITGGEGYHNFHHRFPSDYRNAVRWYQYDPTKWFIWTMKVTGLAHDLKSASSEQIRAAQKEQDAALTAT